MKTGNVLAIAAGFGTLAYFMSRNGSSTTAFNTPAGTMLGYPVSRVPSPSPIIIGYQTGVTALGQTLSDMTGIDSFADIGQSLGGLLAAGQSAKQQRQSQENDLVQKYQNPLLANAKTIIDQWSTLLHQGKVTMQVNETVKAMLRQIVSDFVQVARGYSIAGPGGIATVTHVLNDIWIPNIDMAYAQYGVP
jgi:hypothetical protein